MSKIDDAIAERDAHLRQVIAWHFDPETGSPFWLRQKDELLGFDPREEIHGFDDLIERFPSFDGDKHLRTVPAQDWIPKGYADCESWSMFMTGGTTGDPKLRWGRLGQGEEDSDYAWDYRQFSKYLPADGFPNGGSCLYIGPGGPRRLPLGVEILALIRKAGFMKVDMDVAWMKDDNNVCQKAYKDELVRRAIREIRRNKPDWIFCPPVIIQAIGELIDWTDTTVKGVFAGGTEMSRETVRHIVEVLFKGKIHLVPTYGNALVGLARPRTIATFDRPIEGQAPYSVIYQPLQPRTLLRITKFGDPKTLVPYGEHGFVEITTATKQWFMPRYLERDWAFRVAPTEEYPWDGVGEVGPHPDQRATTKVGVY